MQCGDVTSAELLFIGSEPKVLPMYGAIMKGQISLHLLEIIDVISTNRLYKKSNAHQGD